MTQDHVVSIHPYFRVQDGKIDEFARLCERCVSIAEAEPKCLYYGFSFNGDEAFCREAYEGAEGLLEHLGNIDAVLKEMLGVSELTRLEVHGAEDELARLAEPLSGVNPTYFTLRHGFRR